LLIDPIDPSGVALLCEKAWGRSRVRHSGNR
jgi:hypothetical protein